MRVGLVHGRLKPAREAARDGGVRVGQESLLVATTVIEVGVDVPNASLMVIENAERLGLAQLHQLRGRVGRGSAASSCVLFYQPPLSGMARQRLDVLRETNDGFRIAEKDLELRGPGEVLGTRQTGQMRLRIADLAATRICCRRCGARAKRCCASIRSGRSPRRALGRGVGALRGRMMARLRVVLAQMRPREFAMRLARCPFCGPAHILRLRDDEIGVRCLRCAASAMHLVGRLRDSIGNCRLARRATSANFPPADRLSNTCVVARERWRPRNISRTSCPARSRDGVRCEDMQQLTYADASFDLVTHTEVLEHVPDDAAAFAELRRILRPGGLMIFSVPLMSRPHTIERARLRDGAIEHMLPVRTHHDPLRGGDPILVYRDYGARYRRAHCRRRLRRRAYPRADGADPVDSEPRRRRGASNWTHRNNVGIEMEKISC